MIYRVHVSGCGSKALGRGVSFAPTADSQFGHNRALQESLVFERAIPSPSPRFSMREVGLCMLLEADEGDSTSRVDGGRRVC